MAKPPSLREQFRANWRDNWQLFIALVVVGLVALVGWATDAWWWHWFVAIVCRACNR